MNEHFVNIKVDREERPDVDHIYMNAVQMLTGRGGWPMTVFLTPEGKPFYGGTYFPPEDRHGMPGFPRLLVAIAQAYRDKAEDVQRTVGELMQRLAAARSAARRATRCPAPTRCARPPRSWRAPTTAVRRHRPGAEVPQHRACSISFCAPRTPAASARYAEMTLLTLRRMAQGGIYDQLGGGFHRYSVDERWLVPHFEKMLYDNAQLVPLYLAALPASPATPSSPASRARRSTTSCARCAIRPAASTRRRTPTAKARRARSSSGTSARCCSCLGEEVGALACRYWDVTDARQLRAPQHPARHARGRAARQAVPARGRRRRAQLAEARATLFAAREQRVKPGLDSKVLTAWNGLMISAFAKAAELFGDDALSRASRVDAVAFVERELQRGERLLSTWKDGVAKLNGYLDDYAFFAAALLDVFEAVQERRYLDRRARLDGRRHGALLGRRRGRLLLHQRRPRDADRAQQAGLRRLDPVRQFGRRDEPAAARTTTPATPTICERAEAVLRLFAEPMRSQPFGFANLLAAVDFHASGPREIAVVGDPQRAADTAALLRPHPRALPPQPHADGARPARSAPRPPLLEGKGTVDGQPTVYVCHRMTCSPPATRVGRDRAAAADVNRRRRRMRTARPGRCATASIRR